MRAVERAWVPAGTTGRARVDDRADGDDGDGCVRDARGDDVGARGDQGDTNDGDAGEA